MRTIFLVWQAADDPGNEVIGAFTTGELAQDHMEKVYRERYQEEYDNMIGNPTEGSAMVHPDSIDVDQIDEYFEQFGHECWISTIELQGDIDAYVQSNSHPVGAGSRRT